METNSSSKWKTRLNKFLLRRLPICSWISSYTKEDALCDLIAGITISLTMIPQSIAYAALAGLSPQYGLNSAFMGCLIYVFFGTIKEVVIGPSSLMALLTYQYTYNLNVDFVILLCFLCGIVELIMGLLHLGFLVGFISAPVVSGFTTATSIIIVVAQLKGLFGLYFKSLGFVDNVMQVFNNLSQLRLGDTILGISCIIFLLLMRQLKEIKLPEKMPKRKLLKNTFWFLSTARNASIVLITSLISMAYESKGLNTPFITTKHVESGIPNFQLPPIKSEIGNQTYTFIEMVPELGSGYIIIPVVAVLANVAIAKAFARGTVDATQEMLTLALCNIFGSCFQSMPTCGAFTRSAVISASGVRTPFACLYSAAITLLALAFLGPYFHYIPRSTLAAVLIAAVIFLIDWEIIVPLYKSNRFDLLILIATLLGCLGLGIEIGMLIGVIISLMQLIYKWARPGISVETTKCNSGTYKTITPQNDLYFPSVDYISSFIMKNSCSNDGNVLPVLIDCSKIKGSDYSTAKSMATISKVFEKRGQSILLANVPENILKIWKSAGCADSQFCGKEQVENSLFGMPIERKRITEDKNHYGDHNSAEEIRELVDKNPN
ncbi:hypothetical protein O3M35_001883 [Rhynocoris fuscipes]